VLYAAGNKAPKQRRAVTPVHIWGAGCPNAACWPAEFSPIDGRPLMGWSRLFEHGAGNPAWKHRSTPCERAGVSIFAVRGALRLHLQCQRRCVFTRLRASQARCRTSDWPRKDVMRRACTETPPCCCRSRSCPRATPQPTR
jgi:hypothetical protein